MLNFRCNPHDLALRNSWKNILLRSPIMVQSSIQAVATMRNVPLNWRGSTSQNRPTLRAFEQAYETAMECGQSDAAEEILTSAEQRWETTLAFESSPIGRPST